MLKVLFVKFWDTFFWTVMLYLPEIKKQEENKILIDIFSSCILLQLEYIRYNIFTYLSDMKYKDLFNQNFRSSFDKLMSSVTDFKSALRLTRVKKAIMEQAEIFDKLRAKIFSEKKDATTDAEEKEITDRLEAIVEEDLVFDRVEIDGIEKLGLSALTLEQIEKVVILPDTADNIETPPTKKSKRSK